MMSVDELKEQNLKKLNYEKEQVNPIGHHALSICSRSPKKCKNEKVEKMNKISSENIKDRGQIQNQNLLQFTQKTSTKGQSKLESESSFSHENQKFHGKVKNFNETLLSNKNNQKTMVIKNERHFRKGNDNVFNLACSDNSEPGKDLSNYECEQNIQISSLSHRFGKLAKTRNIEECEFGVYVNNQGTDSLINHTGLLRNVKKSLNNDKLGIGLQQQARISFDSKHETQTTKDFRNSPPRINNRGFMRGSPRKSRLEQFFSIKENENSQRQYQHQKQYSESCDDNERKTSESISISESDNEKSENDFEMDFVNFIDPAIVSMSEPIPNSSSPKKDSFLDECLQSSEVLERLEADWIYPLSKRSVRFPKAHFFCRLCDYHCDTVTVCNRHMKDRRHRKLKELKEMDLLLENLPSQNKVHKEVLSELLEYIEKEHGLDDKEIKSRNDLITRLNEAIQVELPFSSVALYGSSQSGFGLKNSDVNIDLIINNKENPAKVLMIMLSLLQKNADFTEVKSDFSAKNPTIYFNDQISLLNCAISTGNTLPRYTTQLQQLYCQLDSRVKTLGVALRYWAKLCLIDCQSDGTLPAYAFNLMLIYFLQHLPKPVIPVLHEIPELQTSDEFGITINLDKIMSIWTTENNLSLGELWIDLFRFYAVQFKINSLVISIRQSKKLTRDEKKWNAKKVAIEDPFSTKRNIARSISNKKVFEYVINTFRCTYKYFGIPQTKWGPAFSKLDMTKIHKAKCKERKKTFSGNLEMNFDKDDKEIAFPENRKSIMNHFHFLQEDELITDFKKLKTTGDSRECDETDSDPEDIIKCNVSHEENFLEENYSLCQQVPIRETLKTKLKNKAFSDVNKPESLEIISRNSIMDQFNFLQEDELMSDFKKIKLTSNSRDTDETESDPEDKYKFNASSLEENFLEDSYNFDKQESIINGLDTSREIKDLDKISNYTDSPCSLSSFPGGSEMAEQLKLSLNEVYDRKVISKIKKEDLEFKFDAEIFTDGKKPDIVCNICQKEGHLKQECPDEMLPKLCPLPSLSSEFKMLLNSVCKQVVYDFELTETELQRRKAIVENLEEFIRDIYPVAKLELFGSLFNGFGFRKSDLDICLTFEHKTNENLDCVNIIETLTKKLRHHKSLRNVLSITTAKVPIVKFVYKYGSGYTLEGDISLYNTLAQFNTKMLKSYSEVDPRVRPLGYTMKVFAKLCDVGDASRGSLSSYAYILMVIYYLQQKKPPVLPVLQELYDHSKKCPEVIVDGWNAWFYDDIKNLSKVWPGLYKNKESVGELWLGLLRFYTEEFNFKDYVISIRQLQPLLRFEKLWNSKCIAIEDPFDLSHNLGAGVSRKMNNYIMKALINGRQVFGIPIMRLPDRYNNFSDYFFDPELLTDSPPPNDRGCRICGKIGHFLKECPRRRKDKERIRSTDKNLENDQNHDDSQNQNRRHHTPEKATSKEKEFKSDHTRERRTSERSQDNIRDKKKEIKWEKDFSAIRNQDDVTLQSHDFPPLKASGIQGINNQEKIDTESINKLLGNNKSNKSNGNTTSNLPLSNQSPSWPLLSHRGSWPFFVGCPLLQQVPLNIGAARQDQNANANSGSILSTSFQDKDLLLALQQTSSNQNKTFNQTPHVSHSKQQIVPSFTAPTNQGIRISFQDLIALQQKQQILAAQQQSLMMMNQNVRFSNPIPIPGNKQKDNFSERIYSPLQYMPLPYMHANYQFNSPNISIVQQPVQKTFNSPQTVAGISSGVQFLEEKMRTEQSIDKLLAEMKTSNNDARKFPQKSKIAGQNEVLPFISPKDARADSSLQELIENSQKQLYDMRHLYKQNKILDSLFPRLPKEASQSNPNSENESNFGNSKEKKLSSQNLFINSP